MILSPKLRFARRSLIIALALLTSRQVGKTGEPAGPALPARFAQDGNAGSTGGLPNRITHRSLGIAFRLIPAGAYRIGSDEVRDSRAITVRLSAFYVAESQVTREQAGRFLHAEYERRVAEAIDAASRSAERLSQRDEWALRAIEMLDPVMSAPYAGDRLRPIIEELLGAVGRSPAGNDAELAELTSAERERLRDLERRFFAELSGGDHRGRPYDTCHFVTAVAFAKSAGCSLPTEAQWETAAGLATTGAIAIDGLFDEIFEWCSDLFACDYFERTDDVIDPTGPTVGRISAADFRSLADSSPVPGRIRKAARGYRVLRDDGASVRAYASPQGPGLLISDPFTRRKGIRLVLNPPRPLAGAGR